MQLGNRSEIPIVPGVMPEDDATNLDSLFFTDADKIRFQNGKLRKIKGWQRIFSNNFQRMRGAARTIFTYQTQDSSFVTIVGTHTCLYAVIEGDFFNITPLKASTVAIANSLYSEYNTQTINVTTTNGSSVVTLALSQFLNTGDQITISGVAAPVNGIPAASFNTTHFPFVVNNSQIKLELGAVATSSGTAAISMTWATSYLYVYYPNHGLTKGDRVKLAGATDVGNIIAAEINLENIVTNVVDTDYFVIQTTSIVTSSVAAGGGAGTTIATQINAGLSEQSSGFGYGGGLYGMGLYGTALEFTGYTPAQSKPRIWSMDSFGGYLLLTPGDPATTTTDNFYVWKNDTDIAPTLVSAEGGAANVPLAVKWIYVSNGIAVALGSGGILNKYNSSNSGDYSVWTLGPNFLSYESTIEQAGPLISQATSRNKDLMFSEDAVYVNEFVSAPYIWIIKKLFASDGIIGPKARVEIEDAIFWMGKNDFYVYDGSSVNVLANNTVKRYVYDNIDMSQSFKCFARSNPAYNEVSFYYVKQGDAEPNNYVTYNYREMHWVIGTMPRTAAEEPINAYQTPLMIQSQVTKTVSVPSSLRTYFYSLGAAPLATTNASNNIVVTVNSHAYLKVGDYVTIAGVPGAVNGIPAAEINGRRQITAVTYNTSSIGYGSGYITNVTIQSVTNATSTGTGGGAAVTLSTHIIGLTLTSAPTQVADDIISILGAETFGGINASVLNNASYTIRYIDGNTLQVSIGNTNFATSSVTSSGGLDTTLTYTSSNRLFQHEYGLNDYNENYNPITDDVNNQYSAMNAYAISNYAQIASGANTMVIYSVYPDSYQNQNMSVTLYGKLYAQSPVITKGPYVVTQNTTKFDVMLLARQRQIKIQSNVIDGDFLIGKWIEEVKESSTR